MTEKGVGVFSARRVFSFVGTMVFAGVILGSAPAAPTAQKLTVYAVPTTAQFMNHADDRLRGMSTNPFKVNAQALVIVAKGNEKKFGPFPGDDILYSFKLYADPKLNKRAGSAMFTCYHHFAKRATCESYFDLKSGLVLASGQVVFNGTRFTLGITGGTGRYLGASGEVRAAPAARNAERLELRLLDSR